MERENMRRGTLVALVLGGVIALSLSSAVIYASASTYLTTPLPVAQPNPGWGMMGPQYRLISPGQAYPPYQSSTNYGVMGMISGGMAGMMGRGYYCPMWNTVNGDIASTGYYTVLISGNAFNPSSVTVKKGSIVTWINMDFAQHTVTSGTHEQKAGLFDSGLLRHMDSFSFTFNETGTYQYHCDPHPWMNGTVIVEE